MASCLLGLCWKMSNFVGHCLVSTVRLMGLSASLLLACSQQEILFAEGPTAQDLESEREASSPAPSVPVVPVVPSQPSQPSQPALPMEPPVPVAAAPEPPAPGPSGPGGAAPQPVPEPAPCTAFGAFAEPEPITGLGLVGDTLGPALSADGLTMFFSLLGGGSEEAAADENIFSAPRKQGGSQFAPASLVPNLDAGGTEEGTPFLSFDGLSLYFFSTRPGPGAQGDRDIWVARRPALDAPFEEPAVVSGVNGPALDHLPHLTRDERAIFFVSNRESANGASNLWMAERESRSDEFSAPAEVPGINGSAREEGFTLSADGLTLFFASNRLTLEQMDLFVATRPDAAASFAAPEPLVQLNSEVDELDPQLSPDGSELFFASSRDGAFQLFRATRQCDTP